MVMQQAILYSSLIRVCITFTHSLPKQDIFSQRPLNPSSFREMETLT